MKILVADDSRTTLALITESLKKMGHIVIPVNDGFKAIEAYKTQNPDLIILDVIMEGMDGFECAKRIRSIDKENEDWIPVIFLSGAVDDENIAKGIDAGGDDYLTKPFSELTLASKIKAMQRISDMRKKLYKTTQQLKILSSTDPLTGLNNRLKFENTLRIKTTEARNNNKAIALLFLDLDNFKTINDTLGHQMGDLLLQQVADRLKSCLKSKDYIARLGGDEFAIILEDLQNMKMVNEIAQKMIYIIDQPYKLENDQVTVGASIGIAYYLPKSDETITESESLLMNADIAMYHAKEVGRNNYQFYTKELHAKHHEQVDLKNSLKHAVKKNELFIKYQPVFDLNTKKIQRIEALVHWLHPKLGIIPAAVFVPMAEELGLIDEIEKNVIEQVCREASKWLSAGLTHFKISINISPRELLKKEFPINILKILEETHIPASCIEFEITETSVLTYCELSQEIINKIHEIGIGIVLDDFGTGFSSITHLKKLPINGVKIDKVFINDALLDSNSKMIVKSIISFCKNLQIDAIAEGIETEDQLKLLIQLGCPQGQGYLLSNILNNEEITALLKKEEVVNELS